MSGGGMDGEAEAASPAERRGSAAGSSAPSALPPPSGEAVPLPPPEDSSGTMSMLPRKPNWPMVKKVFEGVTAFVGGGTALFAVGAILLMARLDLPTAAFLIVNSQPINIALASLTTFLPLGAYILLMLSPRLFAPSDEGLEPGSPRHLALSDYRRALDLVGITLGIGTLWLVLVIYVPWYSYGTFTSTDDVLGAMQTQTEDVDIAIDLLNPLFLLALAALGVLPAWLFMRLARSARRADASAARRRALRVTRVAIRVLQITLIVIPVSSAIDQALGTTAKAPPLRVVYFEDDLRAATAQAADPDRAGELPLTAGWSVRWMVDNDDGFYFLPEDLIVLDPTSPTGVTTEREVWAGPSKILWRGDEPLSVVMCDFQLTSCGIAPPALPAEDEGAAE